MRKRGGGKKKKKKLGGQGGSERIKIKMLKEDNVK